MIKQILDKGDFRLYLTDVQKFVPMSCLTI